MFGRKNCCYLSRLKVQRVWSWLLLGNQKEVCHPKVENIRCNRRAGIFLMNNTDHTPRTGYRKQIQNIDLEFEILNKCTQKFKV